MTIFRPRRKGTVLVFLPGEGEILQVKKALMKETMGRDGDPAGAGVGSSSRSVSSFVPSTAPPSASAGAAAPEEKRLAHDDLGWNIMALHSRIPWEDMQ